MAKKQSLPVLPKSGGGPVKFVVVLALAAFVVLVFKAPAEAAQLVKVVGAAFSGGAESLTTFADQVGG